jgi:deoxyribodipyrimidine photo-lyase
MPQRILLWYRNDLRLHDRPPLIQALKSGAQVIALYCFDDRQFARTEILGLPKTGAFRARFLLEAVSDLRNSWRDCGSDLIVRRGIPEEIIPALCRELKIDSVYYTREATSEEISVEVALENNLKAIGVKAKSGWEHTLFNINDLPFKIQDLPELFTKFRRIVEEKGELKTCIAPPTTLPPLPEGIDLGAIPSLSELRLQSIEFNERAAVNFTGGETAGIARLNEYFWENDQLRLYKETRNGMLGADYSSKFSPWLALGCLSPRYIYQQVRKYENDRIENDSTYWLIFELLWRDYFRFISYKHGHKIFLKSGLQGLDIAWKKDPTRFALWCEGQTGFPLVDANMRELAATGFMSNRGRQNVASFLTKNLGIDWRWGAEWFESVLIDYDPCSNWGNWNYTAGVGNDARGFRFFNIIKQSQDYDRDGKYVKHWLPELDLIPAGKVHTPWQLLPVEQERFQVRIGVDYPRAIVDLFKSAKANEIIYNAAV